MKMPNVTLAFAFAFAALAFASETRAQQTYEILFGQSNYDVVVGSSVDIDFMLRETVAGGSTARLAPGNNDGIFFYGVNADFSSFTGSAGSTVASDVDVAINAIFDDAAFSDVDLLAGSVDIAAATTNADGIEVAPVSPDVYEVALGTITVTAGDLGSVTTFSLSDHTNTGGIFTLFADAFSIDTVASYGSTTVTVVTAIPEPTSAMVLLGVAGIGLVRRRRS